MTEVLTAREIAIREMNGLRGRLCTAIEAGGLPKKQERALVTLIKTTSYQSQAVIAELLERLDGGEVSFTYTSKLDGPVDAADPREYIDAH